MSIYSCPYIPTVTIVENIVKGIININYKAIIKVFIEVYFKIITKRSVIFIRSQMSQSKYK